MVKRGPRKIKVPVKTSIESGLTQTTSDLDQVQDNLDKSSLSLRGSTTAEPLSEDVASSKEKITPPGKTWPDIFDDIIQGSTRIRTIRLLILLPIVWVVLEAWLFIQDNAANRLLDWQGIKWFGAKFLVTTVFLFIVSILIVIISVIENKLRNNTKNKR